MRWGKERNGENGNRYGSRRPEGRSEERRDNGGRKKAKNKKK